MMVIKRFFKLFFCCTLIISHPVFASEKVNPQSPEAIKQMADELEAERKAREAGNQGGNIAQDNTNNTDSGNTTSADLEKLKQQCESAREQQIAPLRKQAIDECIAKGVKSASECATFYTDYGNAGATKGGGFRQRMFHNIPECQEFYEAEEKFRKNK
jgi:predicted amidohydrolase YtcJ